MKKYTWIPFGASKASTPWSSSHPMVVTPKKLCDYHYSDVSLIADQHRLGWHAVPKGTRFVAVMGRVEKQPCAWRGPSEEASEKLADDLRDGRVSVEGWMATWGNSAPNMWVVLDLHNLGESKALESEHAQLILEFERLQREGAPKQISKADKDLMSRAWSAVLRQKISDAEEAQRRAVQLSVQIDDGSADDV